MRGTFELPSADHERLQAPQIGEDQRCLAQHEGERECDTIEEWKQLNAQVLLAWRLRASRFEAVDSVRLLSVDDEDL